MAAASYHARILIPKYIWAEGYRETANRKPRIAFCGKIICPSFDLKVSNV